MTASRSFTPALIEGIMPNWLRRALID